MDVLANGQVHGWSHRSRDPAPAKLRIESLTTHVHGQPAPRLSWDQITGSRTGPQSWSQLGLKLLRTRMRGIEP